MNEDIITDLSQLDKYLNKINIIFPIKNFIESKIDAAQIKMYYNDSSSGYKYIHSKEGAVHMAINYDKIFNKDGYYTQVKEISKIIADYNSKNILELGCGKGFNSEYLAKNNCETQFIGIDITEKHLQIAKQKAKQFENLNFQHGDFQNIEFQDNTMDLVFELESVCHAKDSKKVLSEVYRVLKPKGQFVLYEGFRNNFNDLPGNLQTAVVLTEKAMAVEQFQEIKNWLLLAQEVGFKVIIKENISYSILPNLGRLQKISRGYFKYPFLSKLFLKILPKNLIMNSIAGLLMPFTVDNKAHLYYKIVLEK